MSTKVKLTDIVTNAGTQLRSYMNTVAVEEYAALMKDGIQFDPIELAEVPDGRLILINGFHRVSAAKKAGLEEIDAVISIVTLDEALWMATIANKRNGVRRSADDIRNAISAALLHPYGKSMSDRQIAEHIGCSHPTVGSVRAKLVATGKISSDEKRVGKDGRAQNTEQIGLKHQLENWQQLIYAPWKNSIEADIPLILHEKRYLFIHTEYKGGKSILAERYHIDFESFTIRGGNYHSGHAAIVDKGYVDLFQRDGYTVSITKLDDLPKGMISIAKQGFSQRGYNPAKLHTFVQVDPSVSPGDLIAFDDRGVGCIAEVVGRSDSFVHVRHLGNKTDYIVLGEHIISIEAARKGDPGINWLRYSQLKATGNWYQTYPYYKRLYAPDALFVLKSATALIALGDDAARLFQYVPKQAVLVPGTEYGDVCILTQTGDPKNITEVAFGMEVYNAQSFEQFWRSALVSVAASKPAAAVPEAKPTPLQQQQAEWEHVSDARAAGDERSAALWSCWHALEKIGTHIEDLELSEDDPLMGAAIPFMTLQRLIADELGIELENEEELDEVAS